MRSKYWSSAMLVFGLVSVSACAPPASPRPATPAAEAAAGTTVLRGDSAGLGRGIVSAWVEVGADGAPRSMGVSLPEDVLVGLPTSPVMLSLKLPEAPGLPFRHVLFDWNPGGHPPAGTYDLPHFDTHFYTLSEEERETIGGGPVTSRPAPRFLPEQYVPVPQLGLYSFPKMGVHWMDRDARELHGSEFDETLIYGSHGEETVFIEPMFTKAFLEAKPDLSAEVHQPEAVARSGFYPTRYRIRYQPDQGAYQISFDAFRWREAESGT